MLRGLTNEIQQLRTENQEVVRLRAESQEMEGLRNDQMALLKLRNEIHELRNEKVEWDKAQAAIGQTRFIATNQHSKPLTAESLPAVLSNGTSSPVINQTPKPWLGFYWVKVPPDLNPSGTNNVEKSGALVSLVQPGSPAERAGLEVDDTIVGLDNQPVGTVEELDSFTRKLGIGQSIILEVIRQGAPIRLEIQIEQRPKSQ
jgi:predicted metalloprotease with PDZ domain